MSIDFDFATRDDCLDRMVPSDLRQLVAERDRLRAKYDELIMQVSLKHPGETRHETAVRYLRNAERHGNPPEAQSNE